MSLNEGAGSATPTRDTQKNADTVRRQTVSDLTVLARHFDEASKRWPNLTSVVVTWPEDADEFDTLWLPETLRSAFAVAGPAPPGEMHFTALGISDCRRDTPAYRYRPGLAGCMLLSRSFGIFGNPQVIRDPDDAVAIIGRWRTLTAQLRDPWKACQAADPNPKGDWPWEQRWRLILHDLAETRTFTLKDQYVVSVVDDLFLASSLVIHRQMEGTQVTAPSKSIVTPRPSPNACHLWLLAGRAMFVRDVEAVGLDSMPIRVVSKDSTVKQLQAAFAIASWYLEKLDTDTSAKEELKGDAERGSDTWDTRVNRLLRDHDATPRIERGMVAVMVLDTLLHLDRDSALVEVKMPPANVDGQAVTGEAKKGFRRLTEADKADRERQVSDCIRELEKSGRDIATITRDGIANMTKIPFSAVSGTNAWQALAMRKKSLPKRLGFKASNRVKAPDESMSDSEYDRLLVEAERTGDWSKAKEAAERLNREG